MTLAETMLKEFEAQAPPTQRFLERLPESHFTWQPHPRSMTAGQLALHIALVPGGVARAASKSVLPVPNFVFPQPASSAEILKAHDEGAEAVRDLLPGFSDEAMAEPLRTMAGDVVLRSVPRGLFVRNLMLNHWYQHRGQLSVYLRILDIPVPSTWGPSADEVPKGLAAPQPA